MPKQDFPPNEARDKARKKPGNAPVSQSQFRLSHKTSVELIVASNENQRHKLTYNFIMRSGYKLKTRLLPFIVLALLIMQLIDPSRVWTVLLIGFGGAWLLGFIWARTLARNLKITREMRFGWAQVGDKLEERFTLVNTSSLPATWVEIEDQSTLPGYTASLATGVEGNGSNQWITSGICKRRGLYWLGKTRAITSDPLGIYSVTIEDPDKTNLMVMPPVVPLPQVDIMPGGFLGEGKPRPNAPEHTVGASTVREYIAGDSLRTVHWKTTARKDKLFVRLFDGAPAGDWWVLVDLQKEVQVGVEDDSTEENAIILAASLADKGLRARQAVGLIASGDHLVWLPPQAGETHRWDILRALAVVNAGDISLPELLERIRPNISRRSSLMVITPNVGADWLPTLVKLTWKGISPTVILLDPQSFGGNQSARAMAATLGSMGISRHIINRETLNRPEAKPGHKGQWEWRVTTAGRVTPVRLPGDSSWRRLSE
jgi:uncharacterized protein (DUF58 family)